MSDTLNRIVNIEILCDGLEFPEGPVALGDGSVLVTEILGGRLTRVHPNGRKAAVAQLGGGPNGAAIGPDGAVYVCNNGGAKAVRQDGRVRIVGVADEYVGGWIERVDLGTGEVARLYDRCGEHGLKAPNDLVFDRHGGFYFSDLGKSRVRDRDRGGVYYALPDGSRVEEIAFPLHTPNGVGLSPGEDDLYVAETETARLWKYRIAAPGRLQNVPFPSPNGGTLVYGAGGPYQRFDSLSVQADGRICVATLERGGITVISPTEHTAVHVPLPDRTPTNICFGGPDLRTAYVTLSETGRLAKIGWPQPGLKLNFSELA